MYKYNPQHRYVAINESTLTPENEMERALYVVLHGVKKLNKKTPLKPWQENQIISDETKYAYDIFCTQELRSLLEAFLLATTDDYEIHQATGVTVDEIQHYRHLFFDTTVFRNDLDIIAFLRNIPDDEPTKELYKMAFHQGFGALRWTYCRDKGGIDADTALKTILSDSYFQYLTNRGKPLTSKVAKEARDIAKTAISCVQTLHNKPEEDKTKEDSTGLKFMFESARPNKTLSQVQKDGTKVVH